MGCTLGRTARTPDDEALIPEAFDEHTIVFRNRPENPPPFSEEDLDRLQVEHLKFGAG